MRHYSDLYHITRQQLIGLENFKDKKADNILKSLEKSKKIEFFRFLFGLGIGEVGIKTAKDLAKRFGTLEEIKTATFEEVDAVEEIGEVIAQNVVDYFASEDNLREIELLLSVGVEIEQPQQAQSNKLGGLTFVLTGTLPTYSRAEMSRMIEDNGGKTASSVSKNTSYVLAGEEAGSKLDKARSLGVPVIFEEDILKMMQS